MKYINRPIWKDVSPIWNHLFTYLILSGLSVAESGSEELSKPWALFVCLFVFFLIHEGCQLDAPFQPLAYKGNFTISATILVEFWHL